MGHRHDVQRAQALLVGAAYAPGHRRAPVMADEMELVPAEPVGDRQRVGDQMVHLVVLDTLGPPPGRVAPLVGRDGPVAGVTQRRKLRPPLPRRLREPVQQEHKLAVGRPRGPGVENELPDGDLQPLELHERDARARASPATRTGAREPGRA